MMELFCVLTRTLCWFAGQDRLGGRKELPGGLSAAKGAFHAASPMNLLIFEISLLKRRATNSVRTTAHDARRNREGVVAVMETVGSRRKSAKTACP
jgi:hypothetical protein